MHPFTIPTIEEIVDFEKFYNAQLKYTVLIGIAKYILAMLGLS